MYENKAVEFVSMSSKAFKLTVSGSSHSDKLCYIKIHSSRPQLSQQGSTLKLLNKMNTVSTLVRLWIHIQHMRPGR